MQKLSRNDKAGIALDPEKGEFIDDIMYTKADGPSIYVLCENTWRNGMKIGDEVPPTTY